MTLCHILDANISGCFRLVSGRRNPENETHAIDQICRATLATHSLLKLQLRHTTFSSGIYIMPQCNNLFECQRTILMCAQLSSCKFLFNNNGQVVHSY